MELSQCELPTQYGLVKCYAFRLAPGCPENLALVWRRPGDRSHPIVRIHSECLTGDVIGSYRCDCGSQFALSMAMLAAAPHAILIYLRGHEGRGIGLLNKIRAYHRQQVLGEDTVDANVGLGLPVDARSYDDAVAFLRQLSVSAVTILTNNPDKISVLRSAGIRVIRRIPLAVPATSDSKRYIAAKVSRLGHLIDAEDVSL